MRAHPELLLVIGAVFIAAIAVMTYCAVRFIPVDSEES